MVPDITKLRSHPDKFLLDHIQGVIENTKKLSNSRFAELLAIFHDLGKLNPNFQDKLDSNKVVNSYTNHSYLSAYAFFCAFGCSAQNLGILKKFLMVDNFTRNDLIAVTVLIAKHHGNLPDFSPEDYTGTGASILSKQENAAMYKFLNQEKNLPVYEFVQHFLEAENFQQFLTMPENQKGYSEKFFFESNKNITTPLDFFLDYQFAFASVIQADKTDAAGFDNFIDQQLYEVKLFSESFRQQLDLYLEQLKQNTDLNQLRTTIRKHAVKNIHQRLKENKRIYELTAPTGSGKTLMMLSLASEIIEEKGAKRIIYGLPFLSITEQVEAEVLKIFKNNEDFIQRIDSKSENKRFEEIQKALNKFPSKENILEANILEYQENTFAYPFVITTFVRFFETLLSNRNAELLKLPNFSKSIFLLDEIQSLPPRLYGFFIAYLRKFCEKFDSYAIISSATQPNFNLPRNKKRVTDFFSDYKPPEQLLPSHYFENNLFNRYQIEFEKEPIALEALKEQILSENRSVLIILNTIDDTKEMFKQLRDKLNVKELLLLNTHFTPQHRKLKVYLAKRRLRQEKRVIIVSTQLIEAGVDIDFPIVYRDFATISSIVQSAGRCNREGKLDSLGKMKLFKLRNRGEIRSDLIYRGKDSELLRFTKESFMEKSYQEKKMIIVQQNFFNRIQSELNFAKHSQNSPRCDFYFLKDIQECQFNKIGRFQLIDKQIFGEEYRYFVATNENDDKFEILLKMQDELIESLKNLEDTSLLRTKKKKIKLHLKKMANQIVQIRLNENHVTLEHNRDYFSLFKIDRASYSFENGVNLGEHAVIL